MMIPNAIFKLHFSPFLFTFILFSAKVESLKNSLFWSNDRAIGYRILDSVNVTDEPTFFPTSEPTFFPTSEPTFFPTSEPTFFPTSESSADPTLFPTAQPSSLTLSNKVYCEFAELQGLECSYNNSAQLCGDAHVFCNSSDSIIGLSYSGLSGGFPSLFAQLLTLESLEITDSQLSGILPSSIGNLASLTSFTVRNSGINGTIPIAFGTLGLLSLLDLSENELTSTIPSILGTLPYLETLDLAGNSFSGMIPSSLCTSNITTFNISGNTGALCYPSCLLTSIKTVDVSGVSSCTSTPTSIPTSVPTSVPTTASSNLCIYLNLYDNFGDGWDTANLLVYSSNSISKNYGLSCGQSSYKTSHCFDVESSENGDFVMIHVVGYKPKHKWDIYWEATNSYTKKVYQGNSETELIFVYSKTVDSSGVIKYSIKNELAEALASHPDNCKVYAQEKSKPTSSIKKIVIGTSNNSTYNTTMSEDNDIQLNNTTWTSSNTTKSKGKDSSEDNSKSFLSKLSNKESVAKSSTSKNLLDDDKHTKSTSSSKLITKSSSSSSKRVLSASSNDTDNDNVSKNLPSLSSKSDSKSKSSSRISNDKKTPSAAYFDLMGTWNSKYSEDFDVNYYISQSNGQKLFYSGTKCSSLFDPSDNYKLRYQDGSYIWRVDGVLSDNKDDIEWDFCDNVGGVGTELFFTIRNGKCYPDALLTTADICAGDESYYSSNSYNNTESVDEDEESLSEKIVVLQGKIQVTSVSPVALHASDIQILSDKLVEEVSNSKLATKILVDQATITATSTTSIAGSSSVEKQRLLQDAKKPLTLQQQQEQINDEEQKREDKEAMKYAHVLEFSLPLLPSSVLSKEVDNAADIQLYMSRALSSKLFLHKVHSSATRQNLPHLQGITSISLMDLQVVHHARENVLLSDVFSIGMILAVCMGMMFVLLVTAYAIRARSSTSTIQMGYGKAYQLSELDNTLNSVEASKIDLEDTNE